MNIEKPAQYDSNQQIRWDVRKRRLSRLLSARAFFIAKFQRAIESMAVQGITTVGNLLYGLLCVRLLSVDGYAKFSLLFAFQPSLALLMDIGSTSALAPLVGERTDDLQLIADYAASIRQLGVRLFGIVAPLTVLVFPLIVKRQHWSAGSVAFLVSMLLISAWFARVRGPYGAVLIVRRDRKRWYTAQMISSLGTLALLLVAWATHLLNEYLAMVLNVIGSVYISIAYFLRSRQIIGVVGRPSRERRQAILRLIMPSVPYLTFLALQAQISTILITVFGRTSGIASVGALARLSQAFLIFSQINPVLLEPYFAKLPTARLKVNYLVAAAAAASVGLSVVILPRIWPGLFLWVLGKKYAHLDLEVFLVMIGSAIYYLSGVLFCINLARRFVYWWANLSIIVLTISVQALFLWRADMGTVRSVLIFYIWSNLVTLVIAISCGIYGFLYGPRHVPLA
jgi:hypothetical protein